jgi:hypothetical protein
MSVITCKNCSKSFEGNYCPECGQSAKIHRINAAYFLHDIPHSVLHVDKGLPYTFVQLIKRSGPTLKEFLEGKRVNHYRPFAYVIILSAISSLLAHWNGVLIQYLHHQKTGALIPLSESFFIKYQSIFIFLMIPIVTLCTWLIFHRHKLNFWEHVLVNTYLSAQLNVIVILTQVVALIKYLITGSSVYPYTIFMVVFMSAFMTYYATTFSTLMRGREARWKLALKIALMCFILGAVYSIGMGIAGINTPLSNLTH